MRRLAVGCLAALALCLSIGAAPQKTALGAKEHGVLQAQLHALALRENPAVRWRCEVRLHGQHARGVAQCSEGVLTATWRQRDGWALECVVSHAGEK